MGVLVDWPGEAAYPQRFVYLDGCVRREAPYIVPEFPQNNAAALVYLSFGSLGAADVEMMKRLIATVAMLWMAV